MNLPFFLVAMIAFFTSAFCDVPEYKISTAQESLIIVKFYLGEIQKNSHDYQFVEDTVSATMKYIWNIENCLGESPKLMDQSDNSP